MLLFVKYSLCQVKCSQCTVTAYALAVLAYTRCQACALVSTSVLESQQEYEQQISSTLVTLSRHGPNLSSCLPLFGMLCFKNTGVSRGWHYGHVQCHASGQDFCAPLTQSTGPAASARGYAVTCIALVAHQLALAHTIHAPLWQECICSKCDVRRCFHVLRSGHVCCLSMIGACIPITASWCRHRSFCDLRHKLFCIQDGIIQANLS